MKMDRELLIPEVADDDPQSLEILRAWVTNGKQHVSIRASIWVIWNVGNVSSRFG